MFSLMVVALNLQIYLFHLEYPCQKVTKGSQRRGAFKGEEIEYSVIVG